MSGQTCTFTSGVTTVSAYCEDGCCTDGCCSDSDPDEALIAIIVASVIGGLLILFLLALCIWCLVRNSSDDDDDKKALTKTHDGKADKYNNLESGNKKRTVTPGYAPMQSIMVTQKKKTPRPKAEPKNRNKMTQTINHRPHPGDILVRPTRADWVSTEGGEKYEAYMRNDRVREFGMNTDGKDVPLRARKKWNSTANFYTRRESLKGSSEEDESLETYRSGEGKVREGVPVNVYGYAARDTSRTNYILTDEEKKTKALAHWKSIMPPWMPHTKDSSATTQTKAQGRWKESMVFVQSQRNK